MLVRFKVENCLSFRDRVEFSMVASEKVRDHPEHVIQPEGSNGPALLKLGILYGANASGKSNLVKAINLALRLIPNPTRADEMDRSLYPEILHSYVANFLKCSAGCGSQLIVTTHNTTLLNQPFLRRDEVWFAEKGLDQSSFEGLKDRPGERWPSGLGTRIYRLVEQLASSKW